MAAYNHGDDYRDAVMAAEGVTVPIYNWAKEKVDSGFYKNPRNAPDYEGLEFDEANYSKQYQDGYTLVGQDRHYNGGSDLVWKRTQRPAAAAPAPEPKPPVVEAKPAPAFDATAYSKPTATTPERPRYELNTRASGYEEWLARNRSGGDSQPDTPSTGGGGGGDRVRFYQDKLMGGEPGAASGGHYAPADAGNGGQRMAGSRLFRERLNRYRS